MPEEQGVHAESEDGDPGVKPLPGGHDVCESAWHGLLSSASENDAATLLPLPPTTVPGQGVQNAAVGVLDENPFPAGQDVIHLSAAQSVP